MNEDSIGSCNGCPLSFALALALLLLPSCITGRMWSGDDETLVEDFVCDVARLLPAGPDGRVQIALRTSAEAAARIGATECDTGDPVWILLQPEESACVADLLHRVRRGAENVTFEVKFSPVQDAAKRSVFLRLEAEFRISRQSRQRQECSSRCHWHAQSRPPTVGDAIEPPVVRVIDYRRIGFETPVLVLLTPVTAACDLVLLPVEIIVAIASALAD